jgi:hypothetical protein
MLAIVSIAEQAWPALATHWQQPAQFGALQALWVPSDRGYVSLIRSKGAYALRRSRAHDPHIVPRKTGLPLRTVGKQWGTHRGAGRDDPPANRGITGGTGMARPLTAGNFPSRDFELLGGAVGH